MGKINKRELLQSFKADLKASEDLKDRIDDKIQTRRSVYAGDLYGNEEEGKSKIIPKVAKRQSEWAHASLKDPFVSTPDIIKCSPITYEDVEAARQNELLLNMQFCRQFDRYKFMTKAIKVLDVDATLVVQTGWEYEDKEVSSMTEVVKVDEDGMEYIATEEVTETVVLKNRPTAKVCRSEDIYIDPTCQDDLDSAQFVIYRYETDSSTLRKDGRYKNLDKLSKESNDDYDYDSEDETDFEFEDEPRKKLVVYEYWGNYDVDGDGIVEKIVCAWVGNTIIRLEDNPYPDKKAPFIVVPYSSVPFEMHGENNIDLIEDSQKIIAAMTRGIINNMAQSTNGQVGLRVGSLDPAQRSKFFKGKNFEFNGSPADIWQGSYNQIPGSAFDLITMMNNEVESLTGTKGFSGGLNSGSLGSTATGARGVLDATSTRRLDLVRNISENLLKPLMRKWMSYNSEFMSDEEVIRVTNAEFVPVRKDDLMGNIDIDISISTAEDNSLKMQELSFLLQTLGNNMPFDLTQIVLAKIARLSKMPDLEQEIKEFKPKADPIEEQTQQLTIQKLQAEVEKLKADAVAKYASASEDESDVLEKRAQAEYKIAQTRKINSESDNLDLKFVKDDEEIDTKRRREDEETKYSRDLEKEEQKRQINLESMFVQAKHQDENIGVIN
jgi:hypothetical protein